MLKVAENKVRIEGILSEVDLDYGSFRKDGKTVECIRGSIKVLVNQNINGVPTNNEIPVHMFASKFTNKGTANPAYESIEKVKNEFTSIVAAGGEANADRVRITSAQISMNEYFNGDKRLISFPRITASFVSRIKKDECKPEATFTIEMVVANQGYKTDAEGNEVEPKVYQIKGIVPKYGNKVDVIDFVCANEKVINAVSTYWGDNDTVKASGRLNFSSTTETIVEEVDFGEPMERQRTISLNELVITGGSSTPLEGDFAFDISEIQSALAERKQRLEAQKEKDVERARQRKAPAPAGTVSNGSLDLGF